MVWTPDAIVSEFMTRDSEPDASNRARYHCNACYQNFPLGHVRDMRGHLLACPSLDAATISSIQARIAAEAVAPKRVVRDPRWTKAEENKLRQLDKQLSSGKTQQRYKKMSLQIGRSAQACRQKLLHLNDNDAAKATNVEGTKWRTRAPKMKDEEEEADGEDDDTSPSRNGDEDEGSPNQKVVRRSTRQVKNPGPLKAESLGPSYSLYAEESDATIDDDSSSPFSGRRQGLSVTTQSFLLFVRCAIDHALDEFGIFKDFYHSDYSIEQGWKAFLASKMITHDEKNHIIAPLIGQWLDGLDTNGFEQEVDSVILSVVNDIEEWQWDPEEEEKATYSSEGEEDEEGALDQINDPVLSDDDEDMDVDHTDAESSYEGDSDGFESDEMLV